MGTYESQQEVEPVRIDTFRSMRRRWKHGEQQESAGLYDDCFTDTARDPRRS